MFLLLNAASTPIAIIRMRCKRCLMKTLFLAFIWIMQAAAMFGSGNCLNKRSFRLRGSSEKAFEELLCRKFAHANKINLFMNSNQREARPRSILINPQSWSCFAFAKAQKTGGFNILSSFMHHTTVGTNFYYVAPRIFSCHRCLVRFINE